MSAQSLASRPGTATRPIGPTVGMVGGGQLARMTHQAAIALGVELAVLTEDPLAPAVGAGARRVQGAATELGSLMALAAGSDVVTFDHERVPTAHLTALQQAGVRVVPDPAAKLLAQDKLHARRTFAALGLPVPDFELARTVAEVTAFATVHGWPLIAKAPRGGYDGRGVFTVADADEARAVLADHPGGVLVEPRLDITCELAVLVARSTTGETAVYPVVETVQEDAMCREIIAPARVDEDLAAAARELALVLVEGVDATGLVAVELFVTADGLMVNEVALRPHNSGHYTIEGCATSQFEQHLRAVLGWPLGPTTLCAPAVVTVNVVGPDDGSDPARRLGFALGVPGAHVHLYGKTAVPGRKLGHVTVCGRDHDSARSAARGAVELLTGERS